MEVMSRKLTPITNRKNKTGLLVGEKHRADGQRILVCCSLVTWQTHCEPSPQLQSHFPSLSSVKLLPFFLPPDTMHPTNCNAENNSAHIGQEGETQWPGQRHVTVWNTLCGGRLGEAEAASLCYFKVRWKFVWLLCGLYYCDLCHIWLTPIT